ncbi:MAG: hypothetical protein LCH84_05710 [Gemmatimonadetes bacterium]|nr:hypothetical protein [Gemmatimonadota bacterium]
MLSYGPVTQTPLAVLQVDDMEVRVTLHTVSDGVEYLGRLFFAEPGWTNNGIPDRGVVPGRTPADVEARARDLRPEELAQRWRRANAEKRRFHGLRHLTLEFLSRVRYMNQVGVSMRSGLLDADGASQELLLTEQQMIDVVRQMRHLAGVES